MVEYTKKSASKEFIVATETGIIYQLQKNNPEKKFRPLKENAICEYMKKITVEKLYKSLNEEVYQVKVPEEIAKKAINPINKMLEMS